MNKSMIFAVVSIVAFAGATSFAQDRVNEDQVLEEANPTEAEELVAFPDTSALDVTLFPAGEAILWGVSKVSDRFDIFRCNGDTGECAWMIWPLPPESAEQGEQAQAPEDDFRDAQ